MVCGEGLVGMCLEGMGGVMGRVVTMGSGWVLAWCARA